MISSQILQSVSEVRDSFMASELESESQAELEKAQEEQIEAQKLKDQEKLLQET
jgi:hypothetical protein